MKLSLGDWPHIPLTGVIHLALGHKPVHQLISAFGSTHCVTNICFSICHVCHITCLQVAPLLECELLKGGK